MASLTPAAGVAANALRSHWDGRFMRRPNENRNITRYFTEPVAGSEDKMGDTLYFRILPVIAANALADSAAGTGLSYDSTAIDRVAVVPAFSYSAIAPTLVLVERMDNPDEAKMLAGYRTQLTMGLWSSIEATAAQNATTISTQLGAPSNISEALFLQAKGILRGQAKEYADQEAGDPAMHLVYDTTQIQYVEAIPAITHAMIRGDKANPTVNGPVQQGWGFRFNSSANVYKDSGIAYNMLFTKEAFAIAFNVKPRLLDPQPVEVLVRYIAIADSGSKELLDECAVIMRSPF